MEEIINESMQDSILFFMLTDKKFLSICKTKINPSIFQSPIQQKICKIVYDFYDKYDTILDGKADEIIIPKFEENEQNIVAKYLIKTFSSNHIREYVEDKVDAFVQKREWESVLVDCVDYLDRNDFNSIEDRVYKIIRNKFSYSDIKDILKEDLKDFYNTENDGDFCCPTGVQALDKVIGGIKYKEISVVVAPLNVGKSWFFVFIGSKALLYGKTVLHITTEMSAHQTKGRYFQRFAGVTSKPTEELDIWSRDERIRFKPEHLGNANKIKKSLKTMSSFGGKLFLAEYPDKTLTIPKLESLLNDMEIEQGKFPNLLIVDGLQGIKYSNNSKNDWLDLENLTHQLRRIAMEKNIAVITSTHSQRAAIGNKIIQSKDVRGSIDILNVADLGLSLNQTNEEYLLNQMRIFVMRSRSSKKWNSVRVYTNFDLGHFCVYSELMND